MGGGRKKNTSRGWKHPKIDHKPTIFGGSLPSQVLTSYLTTAEVAAKLNPKVSERRVRELIRQGRLTAFKKGKGYLIHRDAFYAFAAIKRRPGRPRPGETLEILRVSSAITIKSIQQGTDGPTPVEDDDETHPTSLEEA
jgi:excisionase family DNA binding protein